jgi:hypothetical protein
MQYLPLLVTQVYPSPELSRTLAQEAPECCLCMFKVLFLITPSLIFGGTCHDFPAPKRHTIIIANVAILNVTENFP